MTRNEVYAEIEQTLGIVPSFFKVIPDASLELEWKLFVATQLAESPIPAKYKELIGVAISAATKCRYCTHFHTTAARLNGATDAEIEDAIHFAKATAGWSTYVNGLAPEFEDFKAEVAQIASHLETQLAAQGQPQAAQTSRVTGRA
ncbi:carboxymuconolactone decarboxylase family protein [bacterium]|nr:carboxymuconolactone decarboxylase family protein [bacterium]